MPGIARMLLVLAGSCAVTLCARPPKPRSPEWNPVRTHPVQIGPEAQPADRGLSRHCRQCRGQLMSKVVRKRKASRSSQAKTTEADVAGLAQRTGLALAKSRQMTPSMHVLFLQKTLYGADVMQCSRNCAPIPASSLPISINAAIRMRCPTIRCSSLAPPPAGSGTCLNLADIRSCWAVFRPRICRPRMPCPRGRSQAARGAPARSLPMSIPEFDSIIPICCGRARFASGVPGRLLPGYDFVDQDYNPKSPYNSLGTFLIANDGDGWDPDPSDPGDWISSTDLKNPLFPPATCGDPNTNNGPSDSSWHGTRVMGVLGALTNNGVGIAGMTWNPYLLPVRALGKCGGYDSDIIAGMQWAVGSRSPAPKARLSRTIPIRPTSSI